MIDPLISKVTWLRSSMKRWLNFIFGLKMKISTFLHQLRSTMQQCGFIRDVGKIHPVVFYCWAFAALNSSRNIERIKHFSRSVVSNFLWPYGLQHARPPRPSPIPGVYSNSCPLSQWCHPTISSSVVPFSSHLQSFSASGSFLMSLLFESGS